MITKDTTLNQIAESLLPIFDEYGIKDVWIVGEFATRQFSNDPILTLVYDDSTSIINDDVDNLIEMLGDLSNVSDNIASTSIRFVKSDKLKLALKSKIKLEVTDS